MQERSTAAMRIDFESSGGFANLQLDYHVDTDRLPKEQADEILTLVNISGVFDLQQRDVNPQKAGGLPDVLSYRLSLSDSTRQKTLSLHDVTAPASLRPLLASLQKLARQQKSKGN